MIMQGLLHRSIPMLVRRLVTLSPAVAILTLGCDPTRALVLSQVVLSFGIPFAVLPLARLTAKRELMGSDANDPVTTVIGWVIGVMVSLLNIVLIYLTVAGPRMGPGPSFAIAVERTQETRKNFAKICQAACANLIRSAAVPSRNKS
jgi:hypothetical protein